MNDGVWLTITEYQSLKNLSVSTIRRYIKAGRVKWKLENKKYFIFLNTQKYLLLKPTSADIDSSDLELRLEIERLKQQLKNLNDEKDDLQMLVNLYEGPASEEADNLPKLPIGLI